MSIDHYDSSYPRYGAILKDREMREALNALATHQRGHSADGTAAQLISDTAVWPKNLSSLDTLNLEIGDGTTTYGPGDINLNAQGASPPSTRTLADVIESINTAAAAAGSPSDVAFDLDGYLMIKAPFQGANTYITIGNAASDDARELLFDLLGRGDVSYPYTVNGTDPLPGYLRLDTSDSALAREDLIYCHDQPATITSPYVFAATTVDTREFYKLRIRLENYQLATIELPRGSATSIASIVSAINTHYAAVGTVAYVVGSGGSTRIRLQSPFRPSDPPAGVKLAGISKIEFHYTDADASGILFGINHGIDAEGVSKGSRMFLPYVVQTEVWNPKGIRGMEQIPGIGVWGPPFDFGLETLDFYYSSFHGEIRLDRSTGLPVMYWDRKDDSHDDSLQFQEGWKAAVPGGYQLRSVEDYYGPSTVNRLEGIHRAEHVLFDWNRGTYVLKTGTHKTFGPSNYTATAYDVGNVVELVSLYRDWYPDTSSFRISGSLPINGNMSRDTPVTDNFNRANNSTLGANWWHFGGQNISISGNRAFTTPFSSAAYVTPHALWKATHTRVNCDVFAEFSLSTKGSTPSDRNGVVFGLIHSAKFHDLVGDSDPEGWERGYVARLKDNGTLEVYRRDGYDAGTGTYIETRMANRSFNLDPPPDTTPRVLRFRRNGTQLKVYWNGSLDPTKWANEVASFSFQDTSGLAPPYSGPNFLDYAHTGLELRPSENSVSRSAYADNWGTIVIQPDTDRPEYACLPEVGGQHLRGIVTSLAESVLWGSSGEIVNDGTPDDPILFEAGEGISIVQDTAGKKFTFSTASSLFSGPTGSYAMGWQGAPTPPSPIGTDYDDYRFDDGDFGSGDGGEGYFTLASDEMSTLIVDYTTVGIGGVDPFFRLSVADVNLDPDVMGAYNRLGNITVAPATGFKDWTTKLYARLGLGALDRNTLHTTLRTTLKYLAEDISSYKGVLPSWLTGLNSYLTPARPYTVNSLIRNRPVLGIFTNSAALPTKANTGLESNQSVPTGTIALTETGKIFFYNFSTDSWTETQISGGITVREGAAENTSVSKLRFGSDAAGKGFSMSVSGDEVRIALDIETALKFDVDNALSVDLGPTVSQAAAGDHLHGSGGYPAVPWTGVSGKPSTFVPSTHSYDSHSGYVPAGKVFDPAAFPPGGAYYIRTSGGEIYIGGPSMDVHLGAESGDGGFLNVGHDGTVPLVPTGKFKIADHAHSGSNGSGGKIAYANLAGIPTRFTPAFHGQEHYHDGDDPITADHLRIDFSPTNYTGGTKLSDHLSGIDTAIDAVNKYSQTTLSGSVDLRDWSRTAPENYEMQNLPIALVGGGSTNAGVKLPIPWPGGSWETDKLLISTNRPCTLGKEIRFKVIVYQDSGGSEVEQEVSWTPTVGNPDFIELNLNGTTIGALDKVRVIISSMAYTSADNRFGCEGLLNANLVLTASA